MAGQIHGHAAFMEPREAGPEAEAGADEGGAVTKLLAASASGDRTAFDELFPLVYAELRRIAHARMAHERPGIGVTSVVPEPSNVGLICRVRRIPRTHLDSIPPNDAGSTRVENIATRLQSVHQKRPVRERHRTVDRAVGL